MTTLTFLIGIGAGIAGTMALQAAVSIKYTLRRELARLGRAQKSCASPRASLAPALGPDARRLLNLRRCEGRRVWS